MGSHQVPNARLKCLRVRGYVHRIDGRDQHAGIGHGRGKSAVAPDDAYNLTANLLGEFQGCDQVGADLFLEIAAADGKDEDCVVRAELADAKPALENPGPAFVVRASGQVGDVGGGSVRFDAGNLTEIVDRVRGVGGATANAEDEETALT